MQTPRVLVVEFEAETRAAIAGCLRTVGCLVKEAVDGPSARGTFDSGAFHLALISVSLPDIAASQLSRQLRDNQAQDPPAVMLLAHRTDQGAADVVRDCGAAGMLRKPFAPEQLVERVETVLAKRLPLREIKQQDFGGVLLDLSSAALEYQQRRVRLGPTECRLLSFLIKHHDRVFTRGQLLHHLWTGHATVDQRTVDVHVRRLRLAMIQIGCQGLLQTVRGVGYRLSAHLT